jgi:CHAD domain-containing protein
MRDLKVAEEIKKAASEQLDQERETDAWFDALGAEPVGDAIAA